MIRPWQKVASMPIGDFRIFSLRSDRAISPRTGAEHEFFVIDAVDWVNVIALTSDDQLVMVEQYRHGTSTIELEIPGGMVDREDAGPVAAGVRELREETGYEGANARVIGTVFPNPALMSNTCYTVLVENCRLQHAVELDHGEDLSTRLVPVSDIPRWVATGRVKHAIVVAALCHFDLWQRGLRSNA